MARDREAGMVKGRGVLATTVERKLRADANGRAYADARGPCGGRLYILVNDVCCCHRIHQSIPCLESLELYFNFLSAHVARTSMRT